MLHVTLLGSFGCDEKKVQLPDQEERDARTGLTPAEAAEVLVKVGKREITLGQYAETLLRMDQYERLRYQSEERQKQLLDEMIEVELLAQEARRRGLDKKPEVQMRIRQALRDELLADLERQMPDPESFSEREVKEYYDAHRGGFKEPLRHRVQVIRVGSESLAREALKELERKGDESASFDSWAEIAKKYSLERGVDGPVAAGELLGDLGFVSAPGQAQGDNPSVPPEVREAVFELKKVGDVVSHPVKAAGGYFIVRLEGISPERDRSMQDAERTIRIELRRQKFLEAEKKFEQDLRSKYPVAISHSPSGKTPAGDQAKQP
jgi:parvulin-like peptidyl-prolyl isomerase